MELLLNASVAFFGGILMFLAPCTLPLVPAFLASLTPQRINTVPERRELTLRALLFTFGFTLVFMLFGGLAGFFGESLSEYKTTLARIGGIFIVLFGISLLHVFNIPLLQMSTNFVNRFTLKRERKSTSLILGLLFGLGWTPCAGPILASILLLASQSATILVGIFLLFIFSLGLAIPFITAGLLYAHLLPLITHYGRYAYIITIVSGILLIILGLVLIFGDFIVMTQAGFVIYSFFGYTPMCTIL